MSKTCITVFEQLLRKGSMKQTTCSQLAKELNLERSTVQKAVKKLLLFELAEREQENLPTGGYIFHYNIYKNARLIIRKKSSEFFDGLRQEIDELKDRCNN